VEPKDPSSMDCSFFPSCFQRLSLTLGDQSLRSKERRAEQQSVRYSQQLPTVLCYQSLYSGLPSISVSWQLLFRSQQLSRHTCPWSMNDEAGRGPGAFTPQWLLVVCEQERALLSACLLLLPVPPSALALCFSSILTTLSAVAMTLTPS
jgi:hypothetical protein